MPPAAPTSLQSTSTRGGIVLPPVVNSFKQTIYTASFQGIVFPVASAKTVISHDGEGPKAYRVRGEDWEPTGENGEEGTLIVPLFNGVEGYTNLWPVTYRALIAAMKNTPIGRFVHPTRGPMQAFLKKIDEAAEGATQDGVVLVIEWHEHLSRSQPQTTVPTVAQSRSTPQAALVAAAQADSSIAITAPPVPPGAPALLAGYYAEQFQYLASLTVQTYSAVRTTFAALQMAVAIWRQTPPLRTADAYQAQADLAALAVTTQAVMNAYLPGQTIAAPYVVPVAMPVWEVAEAVYGDATLGWLILQANNLPRPGRITPGTRLTLLPNPNTPGLVGQGRG